MMKKLTFFLFALMTSWNCFAQTPQDRITEAINQYDYKLALAIVEADSTHTDPEWKLQHAGILYTLCRYKEAANVLLEIKEQNPSLRVFVELMNCYSAAGNLESSLISCREALKITPQNSFLKIREASLLFELSHYDEAYTCYDTLYAQDSTLLFLNQMGLCTERLNRPTEAIDLYKRILAIDSFNNLASNRLLNMQIKLKLYQDAYDFSEKFLKLDSSKTDISKLNGISKFFTERYKDAIAVFDKLYTNGDSGYVVTRYLGLSYFMDQDYYAAVETLPLALKSDSTNLDIRFALGASCTKSSYHREGVKHLEIVRDNLLPDETFLFRVYDLLGEAYSRTGDRRKSLESRLIAAEYSKYKATSYYDVACGYLAMKDKQNALFYYQKAWDHLDPGDLAEESVGIDNIKRKTFRGTVKQQIEAMKVQLSPDSLTYGILPADSLSK